MTICLIGMGSNLGDRIGALERAIAALDEHPGQRVLARSRWFLTRPIGGPSGQGEFVNAAVRLETSLGPDELLKQLREVEAGLGRQRRERWEARTVDLDLLLYGDTAIRTDEIEVPHPRMAFRRFVLEPAAEVGGDLLHPVFRLKIGRLLERLNTAPNYIAIAGVAGAGKTRLATLLAERSGACFIADPCPSESIPPSELLPSDRLSRELAIIRRRSEELRANVRAPAASVAVSDFWLGQSLAHAESRLDAAARADLAAGLTEAVVDSPRPKLLVLLGDRNDGWRRRLRELAIEWGECPFLEFDNCDPQEQLAELQAAVEAMR